MAQDEAQKTHLQRLKCRDDCLNSRDSTKNSLAEWLKGARLVQKEYYEEYDAETLSRVEQHSRYIKMCYAVSTYCLDLFISTKYEARYKGRHGQ